MTKLRLAIILLVAAEIGLSLFAGVLSCDACRAVNLGWIGAAFYAALLVAILAGWESLAACAVTLAFATHLVLAARMATGGPICGLCISAAVISAAILVLRVIESRRQLANLAWGLVPSFLAAAVMAAVFLQPGNADALAQSARMSEAEDGSVGMIVFESPACPFCERFRKEVAPLVSAIYQDRVRIRYVDAAAFAEVQVTPTILLRSRSGNSLIEGLPNAQVLIRVIGQMLSSHTIAGGMK
jgi:hypothetical protein